MDIERHKIIGRASFHFDPFDEISYKDGVIAEENEEERSLLGSR